MHTFISMVLLRSFIPFYRIMTNISAKWDVERIHLWVFSVGRATCQQHYLYLKRNSSPKNKNSVIILSTHADKKSGDKTLWSFTTKQLCSILLNNRSRQGTCFKMKKSSPKSPNWKHVPETPDHGRVHVHTSDKVCYVQPPQRWFGLKKGV